MPDLRSGAKASEHAEGTDLGQSAILDAITSLKAELLAKIDEKAETQNAEICKQISIVKDEMKMAIEHANARANALEQCTASLEAAGNSHSDTIIELEQQVSQLRKEVVSLTEKTDLEARSRRCNLRIFGIKERREEGMCPTTFIAGLLQKTLKLDKPPVIDRAHRTSRQAPEDGQQPRAFMIKCHYYQEKDAILRRSFAAQSLISEHGDRIRIFPDYTQLVARQRAAFKQVKQLLQRCKGIKYGMWYPAKMRITMRDGVQRSFTDPVKAEAFVKELSTGT